MRRIKDWRVVKVSFDKDVYEAIQDLRKPKCDFNHFYGFSDCVNDLLRKAIDSR